MTKIILGISAFYHDSAAVLLEDGKILAAAQEERFTRKKHDEQFPDRAISYVLKEAGISLEQVNLVVFYDKPWLKFERLLETYHAFTPSGLPSFLKAMPVWLKDKLFMKRLIRKQLTKQGKLQATILFSEHHLSHAASAFYPSPFEEAAILTIDGVGEWATTTIGMGFQNKIRTISELHFPHSIGLLYSAFTYFLGFEVNGGEYKLMGLASYGNQEDPQTQAFVKLITEQLIDLKSDGSLLLNMDYFGFATTLKMIQVKKWEQLFGIRIRQPQDEITQAHMNLSLAIQQVTEMMVLKLARTARKLTGAQNLVMAGGVALNCVANGKLIREKIFEQVWIQPAAGDAGGALGAAYAGWHIYEKQPRKVVSQPDAMQGAYLGPAYSEMEILSVLKRKKVAYEYFEDVQELAARTAGKIAEGKVVGWFQSRMEFGPRALGNRSLLSDPRNPDMQRVINLKIKFRESFRPFAPAVLEEDVEKFFEYQNTSPYMLITAPVKICRRKPEPNNYASLPLYERLHHPRSDVPAITHIDYSARIQTVNKATNERFYHLIDAFRQLTGYGLLINTSFNVKDEPIVCSPEDAWLCFMATDMDVLVLGNFYIEKPIKTSDVN